MAYTSDFRVKLLMRDIQLKVTEKLLNENKVNPLRLRIFDESSDDHRLWHEGGLTFTNENGDKLGSNDAAWYIEQKWKDPISDNWANAKPILVVEGSYGTETGNVGSAQKARFNHAIGMASMGIIGAYVMPKISEYYRVSKNNDPPPPIWVSKAHWMHDMVLACIGISESSSGSYLMIDAYNKEQLFNLVYALATNDKMLEARAIDEIICEMKDHVKNYDLNKSFASLASQTVTHITLNDGIIDSTWVGKIMQHDERAFTTSKYRNGHIIWGEVETLHALTLKNVYLILPRFTNNVCKNLDGMNKKEWNAIRKSRHIKVITLDDIIFGSNHPSLKKRFIHLRGKAMKGDDLREMNLCWKELKKGLMLGEITIQK